MFLSSISLFLFSYSCHLLALVAALFIREFGEVKKGIWAKIEA
jgi:hypothetical protein